MRDVCATMRGFFSDSLTSWGVVTSRVQRGWLWERMCLHAEPQSAPLSFQSTAVLAVVQLQLPRYNCGRPDVMQTCVHLGHLCLTEASGKTVGLQRTLIMEYSAQPSLEPALQANPPQHKHSRLAAKCTPAECAKRARVGSSSLAQQCTQWTSHASREPAASTK